MIDLTTSWTTVDNLKAALVKWRKREEDNFRVENHPERGICVVANRNFKKWEFALEYEGDFIHQEERLRREVINKIEDPGSYVVDAWWEGGRVAIDATNTLRTWGRLVNYARDPNLMPYPRLIQVTPDEQPRIVLYCHKEIQEGEEVFWDYSVTESEVPWAAFKRKSDTNTRAPVVRRSGRLSLKRRHSQMVSLGNNPPVVCPAPSPAVLPMEETMTSYGGRLKPALVDSSFPVLATVGKACKEEKASGQAYVIPPLAHVDSLFPVPVPVGKARQEKASEEADEVRPSFPVPASVDKTRQEEKASEEADRKVRHSAFKPRIREGHSATNMKRKCPKCGIPKTHLAKHFRECCPNSTEADRALLAAALTKRQQQRQETGEAMPLRVCDLCGKAVAYLLGYHLSVKHRVKSLSERKAILRRSPYL